MSMVKRGGFKMPSAEYIINAIAIDKDGNKTEWNNKDKRIKVLFSFEPENEKIRIYEGILKEA